MSVGLLRSRCGNALLTRAVRSLVGSRGNASSNAVNAVRVVSSEDGRTIVCWHPELSFPYENSLPIQVEKKRGNSVLKVQDLKEVSDIFYEKKEEFVRQELMDLTHTPKHRWFPAGVHKRRRRRPFEYSREYL